MIVSPTSVMRSLLANGVLFDSEDSQAIKLIKNNEQLSPTYIELARRISDRCLQLLEMVVKEMTVFRDIKPSKIANAIVFISRQEESFNMKMQ